MQGDHRRDDEGSGHVDVTRLQVPSSPARYVCELITVLKIFAVSMSFKYSRPFSLALA